MSQPNYQNPHGYQQLGGGGYQYPPGQQNIQTAESLPQSPYQYQQQVAPDNFFNQPPQQQIRYSQMRRSTMQRRMQQQQALYQQEEQQQALNPADLDQMAVNLYQVQQKIKGLKNDILFNFIIGLSIFISVASSKEACKNGWDAPRFMYIISSLYFVEMLLAFFQLKTVQTKFKENLCITFLRYVNLTTMVGFFISGNVGYYNNPDKSDCQSLNTQALIVLIIGYIEMLKCCMISLFLCIFIPMFIYYARQQQQPQWIPAAPQFVQNLYKQKFNDFAKAHNGQIGETDQDKQCSICFLEYGENDEITPLPCDDRHFFHTECIEGWLKSNNSCPMCRQPITQEAIEEQRKKVLQNHAAPM